MVGYAIPPCRDGQQVASFLSRGYFARGLSALLCEQSVVFRRLYVRGCHCLWARSSASRLSRCRLYRQAQTNLSQHTSDLFVQCMRRLLLGDEAPTTIIVGKRVHLAGTVHVIDGKTAEPGLFT